LAIPAGGKAPIMHVKLQQSQFLNAYFDRYLYLDILAGVNDHFKALASYGINFLDTLTTNPSQEIKTEQ
jgi:hypothetical protein